MPRYAAADAAEAATGALSSNDKLPRWFNPERGFPSLASIAPARLVLVSEGIGPGDERHIASLAGSIVIAMGVFDRLLVTSIYGYARSWTVLGVGALVAAAAIWGASRGS